MRHPTKFKRRGHSKRKSRRKQEKELGTVKLVHPAPLQALDPPFDRLIFPLIDGLLDQWVSVPKFLDYFTIAQAEYFAQKALHSLFTTLSQHNPPTLAIEYELNDCFTLYLFFNRQDQSLESKLINHLNKTMLTSMFNLNCRL